MPRCAFVIALVVAFVAFSAPVAADVLELKDGRFVEGVVQMRKSDALVLSRFGTSSIPRDQIVKHIKGPSVDAQIKEYVGALKPEDADGRVRLGAWLKELGRTSESQALAHQVLELEPEHAGAQALLGYVRFRGRWMTPDAAKRAQGLEKHGDKWYTPAEWKLADPSRRAAALAEEASARDAARKRRLEQVIELLVSPDPALRARARKTLRALAKERAIPKKRVDVALKAAAVYVSRLDEAMIRAGSPGSSGGGAKGKSGWMLAEVHSDLTRLKRPITEFATSLASSAAPVKIQLPELRVVRIRTTVAVPLLGLSPSR